MQILLIISIVSFGALVLAAAGIARHIHSDRDATSPERH